jgi:uncharacterized protein (TIGR02996 family)
MTHDEDFIAIIQAAPGDDTCRLVYADWLEEQGASDRADYLRIAHALSESSEDSPQRRAMVTRLLAVAEEIDLSWRDVAGPKFDVILDGLLGQIAAFLVGAVRCFMQGGGTASRGPSRSLVLHTAVRREEAETFLNQVAPQRFRKDQSSSAAYRVVRSSVSLVLGNRNEVQTAKG